MPPVLAKKSNRNRTGERDFLGSSLGVRPDMADSAGAKELWTQREASGLNQNIIHRPNATRRQYLYIVCVNIDVFFETYMFYSVFSQSVGWGSPGKGVGG